MYLNALESDQCIAWSDEYTEAVPDRLAQTANCSCATVAPLQEILRGSLIERYKRCGKPGCKCAEGPGHGPNYYLSVSHPGLRPQMAYVPQESHAQLAEFVANYHRARENLEAISEINRELLRRREALS